MPDLKAILNIQGENLRIDLLTKPPQSAVFRRSLVRKVLVGESKLAFSDGMLLLRREGSETMTIEGEHGTASVLTTDVLELLE